jgi:hypothetical protein
MDYPANPPYKDGYRLEFFDDFQGSELDQSKWFPYMLPHWSDFTASAARYDIGGGTLKLKIEPDQSPWLPSLPNCDRASNLQTGYYAGPKGSSIGQFRFDPSFRVTQDHPLVNTYLPHYGYFEVRLKALAISGYHVALWMIGYDAPQAGEIRVFEIHGGNIGQAQSRIDYGILKWDDPHLQEECYEDDVAINAADFHTYGVEWKPSSVDFWVDNIKLRTIQQSPNYPMQFMLGLYERPYELLPERDDPWPRLCEIDYFRAYQPLQGY